MIHVYLLHPEGKPRYIYSQPAPISDPVIINTWLHLYNIMSLSPEGTEMIVSFYTSKGDKAKAILSTGQYQIDMDKDNNLSIFMYAKDIKIEDNDYIKKPL